MGMEYAGSRMNLLLDPDQNGNVTVRDGDVVVTIVGLVPLPEGARYQLMLSSTAIPVGQESHEI